MEFVIIFALIFVAIWIHSNYKESMRLEKMGGVAGVYGYDIGILLDKGFKIVKINTYHVIMLDVTDLPTTVVIQRKRNNKLFVNVQRNYGLMGTRERSWELSSFVHPGHINSIVTSFLDSISD